MPAARISTLGVAADNAKYRFALSVCQKGGSRTAISALADTVITVFDSLIAVHQPHPATALLRRLYPGADTLLYVEGRWPCPGSVIAG